METLAVDSSKRKWQFGLRSLFVLVTLTAVFLTWSATIHRRMAQESRQRQKHIQQLELIGGKIRGWSSPFHRLGRLEIWPKGGYGGAITVHFDGADFTVPEVHAAVTSFIDENRNLESLHVQRCRGTDRLLGQLPGLEKLALIEIANSDASDDGARQLKDLPALRSLSLANTNVSQDGCVSLQRAFPHSHVTLK